MNSRIDDYLVVDVPAVHILHDVTPSASENFPALHCMHLVDSTASEYVPEGHLMHLWVPEDESRK